VLCTFTAGSVVG